MSDEPGFLKEQTRAARVATFHILKKIGDDLKRLLDLPHCVRERPFETLSFAVIAGFAAARVFSQPSPLLSSSPLARRFLGATKNLLQDLLYTAIIQNILVEQGTSKTPAANARANTRKE